MNRSVRYRLIGLAALGAASLLASSSVNAQTQRRPVETSTGLNRKLLAPFAGGVGVVICEPVADPGTEADNANFGAGCGRWLQFAVGGQGELGKTPLWESPNRAAKELGRTDILRRHADFVADIVPSATGVAAPDHLDAVSRLDVSGKILLDVRHSSGLPKAPCFTGVTVEFDRTSVVQHPPPNQ